MTSSDTPLTDSVSLNSLSPAGYNPRTISTKEFNALKLSIQEFGFLEPIIANTNDHIIISGHQRWRAAKDLKMKTVPVVWVTLDPQKEKALNIAMNKISGEFDTDILAELILELDEDLIQLTGFDEDELNALQADPFSDESVSLPDKADKPTVKKYSAADLRELAKSYHPAQADTILGFCDWLDKR